MKVHFDRNDNKTHPRHFEKYLHERYSDRTGRVHGLRMMPALQRSRNGKTVCNYEILLNDKLSGEPDLKEFRNLKIGDKVSHTYFDVAYCDFIK